MTRDFNASLMAEQWVLGGVMLLPNGFDIVSPVGLTESSFAHGAHGKVWLAIESLASGGKEIDALSVFEVLKSIGQAEIGIAYLVELVQGNYGTNGLRQHAQAVKAKEVERAMMAAGLTIAGFAEDPEITVDDKIHQAQKLVGDIGKCVVKNAPRPIAELALEQTAKWDDMQRNGTKPGWPTRLPALDKALSGGLRPGKLIILAARPGMGKSSLAQQLALTLAEDGLQGLLLSQEMPASELADRAVANIGRVDYGNIQRGDLSEEDWARASEAMDKVGRLPYSIDDQAALTLLDIRTKARMVPGLKVLVLDYLQLCSGSGSTKENRNTEIEQISRGLKTMAKDMGICVIALSQLSREVEKRADKKPMLADLRDSGSIEQDADIVIFLWPVRDYTDCKLIGLAVAKNRQGWLMEVGLSFWGQYQRWAESTADIKPIAPVRGNKGGFKDE
jgi:replicative DNA helicase